MKYVAFLRGINVGGHNIKMELLREHFLALGFKNVQTYIQTGNVQFESGETNTKVLGQKIEKHLETQLGYAVPTFIRSLHQLEQTLISAPFDSIPSTPDTRHMIVFISDTIPVATVFPMTSPKGDYEIIGSIDEALYVIVHLIDGKFQSSSFIEKTFGVSTTARFFHTSLKILEAFKK